MWSRRPVCLFAAQKTCADEDVRTTFVIANRWGFANEQQGGRLKEEGGRMKEEGGRS